MAEQASERIRIEATRDDCLAVVLDFDNYPTWAGDVKQVTVIDRDDEGRGTKVEYRVAGLGKSIRYTLTYDYSSLPESFSWTLVEGEGLRALDGSYRFDFDGETTRVHYDLAVDLSLPVPGIIKRRAAGKIMGTALKELKKAVEGRNR